MDGPLVPILYTLGIIMTLLFEKADVELFACLHTTEYRKRWKFGGTSIWRIWRIEEIRQTLICQLAILYCSVLAV